MLTVQLSDSFAMLFEVLSILLVSIEVIVLMSVVILCSTSYVSIYCLLMCITTHDNIL